jgi:hypothetical protein
VIVLLTADHFESTYLTNSEDSLMIAPWNIETCRRRFVNLFCIYSSACKVGLILCDFFWVIHRRLKLIIIIIVIIYLTASGLSPGGIGYYAYIYIYIYIYI